MSFAKFKAPEESVSNHMDALGNLDAADRVSTGHPVSQPLPPLPLPPLPLPPLPLEPERAAELQGDFEEQLDRALEKAAEATLAPVEPISGEQVQSVSAEEKNGQAIKVLLMRLSDLLFLPSDSIAPQERALSDDLISRLFEKATRESKLKLVERLLHHSEPPPVLVRTMLHSEHEIALPILGSPLKLKQADLISVVTTSDVVYQKCVAEREDLHTAVCDAIIQCADVSTIRVLLRNATAAISRVGFVRLAEKSLKDHDVLEPLIERPDFPADLAHLVFWWSPTGLRRKIIERFASPRQTVFEVVSGEIIDDFDDMIPEVANAFRMVRKAQRMDRGRVDHALDELESGDANEALDTIAAGSKLKAETIAQIFDDAGGEAIGVFCKAVGFGRERFMRLRQILAERKSEDWNERDAINDAVSLVHDTLSTDKADLILRYWDRATREIEI